MGSILRRILPVKIALLLVLIPIVSLFGVINPINVEASSGFSFPWANGTSWKWWDRGANYPTWHNGEDRRCDDENPSVIPPRCALDFGFNSSTINKNVHAIADGTVTKVVNCTTTSNISISHGGFIFDYYHLTKSSVTNLGITQGKIIKKYDNLGEVKTGSFSETCGVYTFNASQSSTSGHLHLVIPTNGFVMDGWDFVFPKQEARHSSGEVRSVNGSFSSNNKRGISPVVNCRADRSCPVYRFHDPIKIRHFYTSDPAEKNYIEANDPRWRFETIAYYSHYTQVQDSLPVHRFWSDTKKSHFYTIHESEKNAIIASYPTNVWRYEGKPFYAFPTQVLGTIPLYRFWSDTYQTHFFTTSVWEKDHIIATYPQNVWKYEGIAYYVKN